MNYLGGLKVKLVFGWLLLHKKNENGNTFYYFDCLIRTYEPGGGVYDLASEMKQSVRTYNL